MTRPEAILRKAGENAALSAAVVLSSREKGEAREAFLAPWAARANTAARRAEEIPCPFRTAFQRDRDRIIHSKAFRRLAHKTQVFINTAGDHYRTRLTHTLEVSQIARTLASALELNEDLTEAIALGHDLGHTPFGHSGERMLNRLNPGGFTHQAQSLRIVDQLAKDGLGLNLTLAVRDGILKHSKGRGPIFAAGGKAPATLEGQLVRVSDIIAYLAHDLDDAARAGLVKTNDVPPAMRRVFGDRGSSRIGAMVDDLLTHSAPGEGAFKLAFSAEMEAAMSSLRDFLYERVYQHPRLTTSLDEANHIVEKLYLKLSADRDLLLRLYPAAGAAAETEGIDRTVTDLISGMTDRYLLNLYQELFWP
ncbi:MAG: deoxyguanosinetriphosphate triphosphohydrolase [Candidatus Adiutrix sp.]|jgi:dGTPase|nr:deoxyguanosinetriphosphate triphosphohydrolase [Candidatus Adiutrix sp.]